MVEIFTQELEDLYDEEGNVTHKVCGQCGELKPISEFYKNGKGPSGKYRYRRDCKECYKQANEGRTQEYRDKKWKEKYGVTEEEIQERTVHL